MVDRFVGWEMAGGEQEDAALVRLARDGDRAAFAMLLGRHWELLLALCRRTLADDELAREAAQEAVLQAMLSLDRLRQAASFGPWLAGIGLNVCRSWLRYRPQDAWSWEALQGGMLLREPIDEQADPEARAVEADLSARVLRAVAGLPSGQRASVLLFYLGGLTYAETAAQLGIEIGAVKTRLHKARAALRKQLMSAWKEEAMVASEAPSAEGQAVEMRVVDVRRISATDERPVRHHVVLEEVGGPRGLFFGVGPFEGHAVAMLLEKVEPTRPLTYQFLAGILTAIGGRLAEVRITRLTEDTYYAVAVVEGPNGQREVDARPSDAVSLALLTGAPIKVAPGVLAAVERVYSQSDDSTQRGRAWVLASSIGAAEIVARSREYYEVRRSAPTADPAPGTE